ncbi:GNAT family N-acetyltransferase [Nocardiopsis salina]|uniref:GNAT family N-acetyltransferase n=1 Tax=Nocardiopsis salina TaxID=245836 RepID=UPI00034847DB|nr:GNAT family N-acetyltransferase [Nocardiopsis salina]
MSAEPTRIRRVEPSDEASLNAWFEVLNRALEFGEEDPLPPLEEMRGLLAGEEPGLHALGLVSEEDGTAVGALLVECDESGSDTIEADIAVLPESRRRGHGTALLRAAGTIAAELGRTTLEGEVSAGPGSDLDSTPGVAFARAHGFEPVRTQDLYVLDLPLPGAVEALLKERTRPTGDDGPEITGWVDVCPEEYAESCAHLRQSLDGDAGRAFTVEDYLAQAYAADAARAEDGVGFLASAAIDADGTVVGLCEVVLLPDDVSADQSGMLVRPDHRERGIGSRLWLRTLTELSRLHPERSRVRTWAAPEGTEAGEAVTELGFRPVERGIALRGPAPSA